MGQAQNYRQRFLAAHPRCAFCGGLESATTIEHCPPRSLFLHRQWPEGFEFPACEACNLGTGDHDALVAMMARMDPIQDRGNGDGRLPGLIKNVNRQFPGFIGRMMPSAVEARRHNRELGIVPKAGETHQEASPVKVPDEMHEAICVFGRKLAKAIYYRETTQPFPNDGCLLLNWFTNADLLREGKSVVFEILKDIAGEAPLLQRGGRFLNDQFDYKISLAPDNAFHVLQANFRGVFGLAVFGCTIPGRLESIFQDLQKRNGREGPFAVLQSPSLSFRAEA